MSALIGGIMNNTAATIATNNNAARTLSDPIQNTARNILVLDRIKLTYEMRLQRYCFSLRYDQI